MQNPAMYISRKIFPSLRRLSFEIEFVSVRNFHVLEYASQIACLFANLAALPTCLICHVPANLASEQLSHLDSQVMHTLLDDNDQFGS